MEGEGQKIELKQGVGEPAPAMPKVMADVVMPISALQHKCRHSFYADTSSYVLDWKENVGIFIGIKT